MNTNTTNTNTVLPFTADELLDALYEAEVSVDDRHAEDVVRTNYSGRGMYGRECFGIVVRSYEVLAVGIALERLLAERDSDVRATQLARHCSTDSMAFDVILYFPGFELKDA